jgi:[acyl-carrier-protein] S-malonyltransferase
MKKFAFVFPGQGSQSVGMMDGWGDHPAVRQTLEEASDVLDLEIERLIREGPSEQLDLTVITQPVMLAAGVACYRAWIAESGPAPLVMAGHSLGEYSALVASGALTLAAALPLVRFRAQAMQEAVPVGTGAMAAILGMEADVVRDHCVELAAASGEVIEAVNFNGPTQTVIAGSCAGVQHACEVLKAKGAKRAMLLAVSAPFHSSLMRPAAERLKERLAATPLVAPQVPVINNIDVTAEFDPEKIRDALYRQAFGPVRWVDTGRALHALGVTDVIECGPGKVLSSMVKRIDAAAASGSVHDLASLAETREQLQ